MDSQSNATDTKPFFVDAKKNDNYFGDSVNVGLTYGII